VNKVVVVVEKGKFVFFVPEKYKVLENR